MTRSGTTIVRIGLAASFGLAFTLGSPGVPVSAAIVTPGEVCLFNAPSGAPINLPNGTVIRPGHIGWGFRNRTGDSWTFGATEDAGGKPLIGSGDAAKAASSS